MIRDQFKPESYFEEFIFTQENRIAKFSSVLKELDIHDIDKTVQCKTYLCRLHMDLISAKYSLGLEKGDISDDVKSLFSYICKISSYNEMINYLSLAIIFDINIPKSILDMNEYDDALVDWLKGFWDKTRAKNTALTFPENYKVFYDFISNKIKKDDFKQYMDEEWYESCKEFAFFNSHELDSKTYSGYWCWIAAAIIKIKSIDVKGKYIPSDLI